MEGRQVYFERKFCGSPNFSFLVGNEKHSVNKFAVASKSIDLSCIIESEEKRASSEHKLVDENPKVAGEVFEFIHHQGFLFYKPATYLCPQILEFCWEYGVTELYTICDTLLC